MASRKNVLQWHTVSVFGVQAERCAEYLHKGSQVLIEGKLRTREWEDSEGSKCFTTEIVARRVQFMSSSRREEATPTQYDDSDIPF